LAQITKGGHGLYFGHEIAYPFIQALSQVRQVLFWYTEGPHCKIQVYHSLEPKYMPFFFLTIQGCKEFEKIPLMIEI
jgi:hypothetical protein